MAAKHDGEAAVLVEFSVGNFRSIRDTQTISFVASSATEHEKSHVIDASAPGVGRLLRSAVLYGANAAGKSNLLRALDAMQDIVVLKNQEGDLLPITPFLFDERATEPTFFEVVFVSDGVKYQFGFECTQSEIREEWLYAYPEKRAQRWYHRRAIEGGAVEWEFGGSLRGNKKDWSNATRSNALFLSTAVQLNAEQLKPIFSWFRAKLRVLVGAGFISDNYSIDVLESGDKAIIELMKGVDAGIADLEVFQKPPGETFREIAEKALPDDMRQRIIESASKAVRAKHLNHKGEDVWLEMENESDGTRKIFAFAGPISDVLKNGRILIIDELNNSLHPIMVRWLIGLFNNSETNKNGAQLFFATHATSILSLEIFRRDQIWFAEKSRDGGTVVYPLTDFSPRKEVSLAKGYLQGRYGAIPFLTSSQIF